MKMSDIGFLKSEPNRTDIKIKKPKNSVSAVRFSKNRLRRFVDGFSRCLIHNSSSNMIESTVKVFFFSYSYSYRVTLFNELFSEESCSVIGLSEKMGFLHAVSLHF